MMLFGISPLRFDKIITVINQKKKNSNLSNFHFSDIIEKAAQAGFKHCELTSDVFQLLPLPINNIELEKLKKFKKEYEMSYSVHLPIASVELASPNKFIREGSIQSLMDSINSFKILEHDIDMFVLHTSGSFVAEIMKFSLDSKIKQFLSNIFIDFAIQSINKVISETEIDKTKIAIENAEFPIEGTIEIIKKLNGPKLCMDTAHFLAGFSGNVDLIEITEKYLDITSEIHLQDYADNGLADHNALGVGKKFPVRFLKIINEYEFKGPIVFELSPQQAIESINFIKKNAPEIKVPEIKNLAFY